MPNAESIHNFSSNKEIAFFTTAIGTRWLFYQQYLLRAHYPGSQRYIINGNVRWNFDSGLDCVWYDFVKHAIASPPEVKYFVCIDEDCFITRPAFVYDLIKKLENEQISLIGPPDVIDQIRGANPLALNSFFMIGKIADLRLVYDHFDTSLAFEDLDLAKPIMKNPARDAEPYYPFFWNYYRHDLRIAFLKSAFDPTYCCTALLDNSGSTWALHMWYTRKWGSKMDFCGQPNRVRYKTVGIYLEKAYNIRPMSLFLSISAGDLTRLLIGRFFSKSLRRMKQRLGLIARFANNL
jgi:hypothetical protein